MQTVMLVEALQRVREQVETDVPLLDAILHASGPGVSITTIAIPILEQCPEREPSTSNLGSRPKREQLAVIDRAIAAAGAPE